MQRYFTLIILATNVVGNSFAAAAAVAKWEGELGAEQETPAAVTAREAAEARASLP
jgi:Na+/H+-dicarboxylate symporter